MGFISVYRYNKTFNLTTSSIQTHTRNNCSNNKFLPFNHFYFSTHDPFSFTNKCESINTLLSANEGNKTNFIEGIGVSPE
jgi:hypothetical protein